MKKRALVIASVLALVALVGCDILDWLGEDSDTQAVADTVVLGLFKPDLRAVERSSPRSGAVIMEALAAALAERCASLEKEVRELKHAMSDRDPQESRSRLREHSGLS